MRKILAFVLASLLPALAGAQTKSAAQSRPLVFTHATVIDTTGGPPQSDSTVIVAGNRIVAFGKTGRVRIPEDAHVVNAAGKFLLPGLWDMHFHSPEDKQAREIFLPLAIANGVTGVRNMFGSEALLKQRDEVRSGTLLGPRMIIGSPVVDGPDPMWPGSVSVADAPAGRQAVRTLKQRGYDFIKVYQFLPREVYLAIADEAKKQNIVFAGHVPFSLSAAEASLSVALEWRHHHTYGHFVPFGLHVDALNEDFNIAIPGQTKMYWAEISNFSLLPVRLPPCRPVSDTLNPPLEYANAIQKFDEPSKSWQTVSDATHFEFCPHPVVYTYLLTGSSVTVMGGGAIGAMNEFRKNDLSFRSFSPGRPQRKLGHGHPVSPVSH